MGKNTWTREQRLKVLAMYCQIPFGKMHSRNPAVILLAQEINRTPAAVALKLVNFASLDPELHERGIRGMRNASAADRSIWTEFFGRWDVLAENAIYAESLDYSSANELDLENFSLPPSGPTETIRETSVRRGQRFFRRAVLAAHDGKCCITGIACQAILRASHIVPWSRDVALRLDPRNGLCLNALHDAAFDRGLITLNSRFELVVSNQLKREVPDTVYQELFASKQGLPIIMPERFKPSIDLMNYHRTHVFCN